MGGRPSPSGECAAQSHRVPASPRLRELGVRQLSAATQRVVRSRESWTRTFAIVRSPVAWLGAGGGQRASGVPQIKSVALSAVFATGELGRSGGAGLGESEALRPAASPGRLPAGGWCAAAAPSVPSPHSMAQGSRPPDKERVRSRLPAGCSSGSLNARRAAAATGTGGEGSPRDPRPPRARETHFAQGALEGKCTVARVASPPGARFPFGSLIPGPLSSSNFSVLLGEWLGAGGWGLGRDSRGGTQDPAEWRVLSADATN